MDNNYLNHWYPVKLYPESDGFNCKWRYFKGIEFTDPFFDETIIRAGSIEINAKYYRPASDLGILPEWADRITNVDPTLFIFHVSRCGSTLLTQVLGLNDRHIVLSEVPFIDDILKQLNIEEWVVNLEYQSILKAAIKLYGRDHTGTKNKLFIKLDSWHLHYLPLFRLLYPATPFLLLFRNPEEVLLSQQKKRGMHAVPGLIANHILEIATTTSEIVNFDAHMINVLESYYKSMISAAQNDELVYPANYNEGIEQIIYNLANIIDIDLNNNYKQQINERCRYNAKFPDQVFKEEPFKVNASIDLNDALIQYNKLEEIRSSQINTLL